MTSSNQNLKLGLIGAGPWGRNFIHTIKEMDGVGLTRLASANPESASLVDGDCEITTDWLEVAIAADLDGVIVATPPFTHAEIATRAVLAGNPVLVEKPLTLDPGEARELLNITEAEGGFVLVDHIHLFSSAWEVLKREAEALGPVCAIVSEAGRWGPFREDAGVLWDWGPHDVAMCCDLLGRPPETVQAVVSESRQTPEGLGETLKLEADFGRGVSAGIVLSNLLDGHRRYFRAYFNDCALVYDDTSPEKLVRHPLLEGSKDKLGPGEPLPVNDEMQMNRLIRTFGDAIREGSRDAASLRLGVSVVEILTRAQQTLDN